MAIVRHKVLSKEYDRAVMEAIQSEDRWWCISEIGVKVGISKQMTFVCVRRLKESGRLLEKLLPYENNKTQDQPWYCINTAFTGDLMAVESIPYQPQAYRLKEHKARMMKNYDEPSDSEGTQRLEFAPYQHITGLGPEDIEWANYYRARLEKRHELMF